MRIAREGDKVLYTGRIPGYTNSVTRELMGKNLEVGMVYTVAREENCYGHSGENVQYYQLKEVGIDGINTWVYPGESFVFDFGDFYNLK